MSTKIKPGPYGGGEVTIDPTTGEVKSVAAKGGWGYAANNGGTYETIGANSGYLTSWPAIDYVLGQVLGY